MEEVITVKVPTFTDQTHGSPYLKKILEEVNKKDVIVLEGYHEFKESYMEFLTGKISFESLDSKCFKKLEEIDPDFKYKEHDPGIPKAFEYILKKLKLKKFIKSEIVLNEKNQTRKIYHITSQGRKVAKSAVNKIISNHENVIWRMDLGLAYLNLLEKTEILESLDKYRKSIETKINGYNDLLDYLKKINCSYNRYELAYRPKYLLQAELKWVEDFISKINVD